MAGGGVTGALLAAAGPSPLWYLTRGTGLVSLVLLSAVVALGIASIGRWSSPGWPRFATAELHRFLSLLAVAFLGVHILTAELDTFAPVGWLAVVVPFGSAYRPMWLGLGTLAFDLVVAVIVTSLLRARLGYRVWRAVHWTAYLSWPLAVVHALGTGTDPRLGWVQFLVVVCVAGVVAAAGWRLAHGWPSHVFARAGATAAGVVGFVIVAVWAAGGPLQAGWAKRAGTPTRLLASSRAATTQPASSPSVPGGPPSAPAGSRLPAPPFTASLSGTITQSDTDRARRVTVTIAARLSGQASGSLRVVLEGRSADGGVALESSSISLGPPDDPGQYQGHVTTLEGTQLTATVTTGGGPSLQLGMTVQIDRQTGGVSGSLRADPASGSSGP